MRISRTVIFYGGNSAVSPFVACPGPAVIPLLTLGHVDYARPWLAHTLQIIAAIQFVNQTVNDRLVAGVSVDVYASGRPLATVPLQQVSDTKSVGFGASWTQWAATLNLSSPEQIFQGDAISMQGQVTSHDQTTTDNFQALFLGTDPPGGSIGLVGLKPTQITLIG